MATVKGDVHDIGKNIVGVVLQCNNYEVIDLGVMVPAQKILDAAKEHDADIIGLSGLITPSLDEMVNFAVEMERQGLEIPLLIGGATTSRAHTAVKVSPRRSGPVVWVKDASRSVPVAAALLDDKQRPALLEATEKDYASLRERHAQKNERPMLTLEKARANRTPIEWDGYTPPVPAQGLGVREFEDYDIAELREYIDWQPFFNAWEMKGSFPDILNNPVSGETARKLYDDAQEMLDTLIKEKWLTANGVIGFFPANAVGDDIEVYTDETRTEVLTTLHNLRQQGEHRDGIPNRSLGDFVAPKDTGLGRLRRRLRRHRGARQRRTRSPSSRQPTTTTARSCWSRSPTGWPRRSPNGCTNGSARSSGDTSPTSSWTTRRSSARSTWESALPPATRPARSTPRRRRSGS